MILELTWRWPFVRRHVCRIQHRPQLVPTVHGQSAHGTPHHAHKSWVKTEHGVGWIHHHEHSGFWVEFKDGRLLQCKHVEHVTHE